MISRAFLAAALNKKVWSDPADITADNFVLPAGAVDGQMDTIIKARTLKNELNYTPSTWAEWTKAGGVVGDSTGLEFTADGTGWKTAVLPGMAFKPSTKYGMLHSVVSSSISCNFISTLNIFNYAIFGKTVGNNKVVMTSPATISDNTFGVQLNSNTEPSGNKIKIRDIRIFELPTGSEIESDFTTLTADELAVKYPYIQGGETRGTGAVTLTSTDGTRTSVATLPAVGHRLGEVYDEIRVNEKLHIQRIDNDGDAVLETPIVTPISIPIVTNGIADSVFRAWQNGSVSVEYEGTLPTVNYSYPEEE